MKRGSTGISMVPVGRRPRCRHDYPTPVRAGVFDSRMKTVCRHCGRIKLTKAVTKT